MSCISNSKIPLKNHQSKIVKYFMSNKVNGIMIVHPTGSGKTLTAVTISQCYLEKNPTKKVIFVGPSSLLTNFKKEMTNYGVKNTEKYIILSYQKFVNKYEEKDIDCVNNLLIIDEAHNLRKMSLKSDSSGIRAKALLACSEFASKRVLLTATPFINDITDFISLINLLYGAAIIKQKKQLPTIYDLAKYLKNRVDYIVPNRTQKDYPLYKEHTIEIEMSQDYEEKYCKLIRGITVGDTSFSNPKSFYNAHRRAVNKIGHNDTYFSLKMDKALEIIGSYKSVIFSNWLEFGLKPISKALKEKGIKSKSFHGGLSEKQKDNIVEEFNQNKFQVLIISGSGKEGLDLKEVRKLVVMDPVWNFSGMEQIRGRAVRFKSHINLPKNERKVGIYYLLLVTNRKDCLSGDSVVYKFVENKKKFQKSVEKILKDISISKI